MRTGPTYGHFAAPHTVARSIYEDKSSGIAGYVTGRQPSAGRRPPSAKYAPLPEFRSRDEPSSYHRAGAIAGGGSYVTGAGTYGYDAGRGTSGGSGAAYTGSGGARSTSVPRPSSRTSGGPAGAAAAAAAAAIAAAAAARGSGRGAPTSSILDSLRPPASTAVPASLAQRVNSSSGWDYSNLGPATSVSALRLKRQAQAEASAAAAAAASAAGGHGYGTYSQADQLRAIYMASGVAGSSHAAPVRRNSMDRLGVPRTGSFSAQQQQAAAVAAAAAYSQQQQAGQQQSYHTHSQYLGGSGAGSLGVPASLSPYLHDPHAHSNSYAQQAQQQAAAQSQRLASGTVLASQYAAQPSAAASTVLIPSYSQHHAGSGYGASSGGAAATGYASSSGQAGSQSGAVYVNSAATYERPSAYLAPTGQQQRAGGLGSQLTSQPTSPAGSSSQTFVPVPAATPIAAADYGARSLQRSGSSSLGRTAAGPVPSAPAAPPVGSSVGRLRALGVASAADDGGVDVGSGSLRRLQVSVPDYEGAARWSGTGAGPATPPSAASTLPSTTAVAGSSGAPSPSPKLSAPDLQPLPQQVAAHRERDRDRDVSRDRGRERERERELEREREPAYVPTALSTAAVLEAGGSSYGSNGSTRSSVAATAGTGVSSASSSRTVSTTSQRSLPDAPPATAQQAPAASARDPHTTGSSGHRSNTSTSSTAAAAAAAAAAADRKLDSPRASALSTSSHYASSAYREPHTSSAQAQAAASDGPPVCGPLPDLPVVLAPRDASAGRGCVGLQNLGNTCFMNSILQSLHAVPELVQHFLSPAERSWSSKAVVAPAYGNLVRDMLGGSLGHVVNPSSFLRKISKHDSRWGDGRQQDSQEFLSNLLEVLQSECNRISGKPVYKELQGKGTEEAQAAEAYAYARTWNDSVVDDIFGGLTQSTIQCHACQRLSHTFEPFLGLAVPIPAGSSSGSSVSVADCLRAFVEREELTGDNSYKCEACKRCQPHSKRLQIFRPPRCLVLTLKRFSQRSSSPGGFFSRFRSTSKNNTPVALEPEPLDLEPYCNPLGLRGLGVRGRGPVAPLYQLVAVSHHSGSLEGGHYTAQARSALDGQWYNFNDSSVRREHGRPSGSSASAYVLFYRLVNLPGSSI